MTRVCKVVLVMSEEPGKAPYNRMVKVKRFGAELGRAATAARSLDKGTLEPPLTQSFGANLLVVCYCNSRIITRHCDLQGGTKEDRDAARLSNACADHIMPPPPHNATPKGPDQARCSIFWCLPRCSIPSL